MLTICNRNSENIFLTIIHLPKKNAVIEIFSIQQLQKNRST